MSQLLAPPLTAIEFNNLLCLFTAWGEARRDPTGTCSRFMLCASDVQRIADLSSEQIVTVVHALGQNSVVQLRPDLLQLLDTPPSLMALFAGSSALQRENAHVPPK